MKKPSAELVIMQTLLQNIVAKQDKQELLIKEMSEEIGRMEKEIQALKLAIPTIDII